MTDKNESCDYSVKRGGLFYFLCRHAGLIDESLGLLKRRIVAISTLAWLPLLILSVFQGLAIPGTVKIPFFYDFAVHARLLFALPLLLLAETVSSQTIAPVLREFLDSEVVHEKDRKKFYALAQFMNKLNHSTVIEALLLAMILAAAFFGLSKHMAGVGTSIWYFKPGGAQNALSWAGWWYAYVALPVFQFLLIRWYLKIVLWAAFLWRVSRMDLRLMATHSDGCAGLSFLGISFFSYWPFLLAHGFLTAGMIANRIFYDGATLVSFKWIILTIVVGLLIFTLGPLCLFSGRLIRAKIEGRLQYGAFAARYMNEFHHKWLSTPRIQQSELIGSADIQSLADMSNSFAVVRAMRIVPFEIKYVLWTALIILAPMAPLLLTMFPLNELLLKAVGIFLG